MQFRALKTMKSEKFRKTRLLQVVSLQIKEAEKKLFVPAGRIFMFLKVQKTHSFEENGMKNREVKILCRVEARMQCCEILF